MQIYIQKLSGNVTKLKIDKSDTIKTLKGKVDQKKSIPPDQQTLIYKGTTLADNRTLQDYQITEQSTIQLILRVKRQGPGGFGDIGFPLNNLKKDNKTFLNFSKNVPKYRYVSAGLNLVALCTKQTCEAFNKQVFIQKGFGTFNIGKEVYHCVCPVCDQKTAPAINIGYYATDISVEGKQCDSVAEVCWKQRAPSDKFTTFVGGDEEMVRWNYLQITTKEVKLNDSYFQ